MNPLQRLSTAGLHSASSEEGALATQVANHASGWVSRPARAVRFSCVHRVGRNAKAKPQIALGHSLQQFLRLRVHQDVKVGPTLFAGARYPRGARDVQDTAKDELTFLSGKAGHERAYRLASTGKSSLKTGPGNLADERGDLFLQFPRERAAL